MKAYHMLFVSISIVFVLSSCSNKKQWEESLKQWEQAVKDRDKIIETLQQQLQEVKVQNTTCQKLLKTKEHELQAFITRAEAKEPPRYEEKLGFSETQRKQIYQALAQSEDRAIVEADQKYPDFGDGHMTMVEMLTAKYREELKQQYELTEDQLFEITVEGHEKNWPSPQWELEH